MKFGVKEGDESAQDNTAENNENSNQSLADKVAEQNHAESARVASGDANNGPKATQDRLDQSEGLKDMQVDRYGRASDRSASDLGVETGEKTELERELAIQSMAAGGATIPEGEVVYTSHPIQNLHLGPYQFENATLRLNGDQVGKFEELLDKLPLTERNRIAKIDHSAVNRIVEQRATQQFDSSVGRAAMEELARNFPKIGMQPVGEPVPTAHVGASQMDNNIETPLDMNAADGDDDSK